MACHRLKARATLLRRLRSFLDTRGLLEVQTPLLVEQVAPELHIEPFAFGPDGPFLITSPELAMKRLLAAGSGSIYQLSSVFRLEEKGPKHHPEFTLLELYLVKTDHLGLMTFVDELLQQALDWPAAKQVDYVELFQEQLDLNPLDFSTEQFAATARERQLCPPTYLLEEQVRREDQLDFLFSLCLEPTLGQDHPVFLCRYPHFMSSLSRLDTDPTRSTRFELFYRSMELGNGFYELKDPQEQRRRFALANQQRHSAGKKVLKLDELFLTSLDQLPNCAGIALGIDRILMIEQRKSEIGSVLSLPS